MKNRWIELHSTEGARIIANVDNIECFLIGDDENYVWFCSDSNDYESIRESEEEILGIIERLENEGNN